MKDSSKVKRATDRDVEVGAHVREQRIAKGMSQTQLGQKIGVTFQQVQKYESGMNRISAGRLMRVASALDVSLAVLLGSGKKQQRLVASPVDDLAIEGASRLLRAYQRIDDRESRAALLQIAERLARR